MKIDNTNFNELVCETAKEYGENPKDYKSVEFASELKVTKEDSSLTVILDHENRIGIGDSKKDNINMQCISNCFEAWSVIFYVYIMKKQGTVILDTAADLELPEFDLTLNKKRNYSRFLYRVLRFSEQYPWFEIGDNLKGKVDEFAEFLKDNTFINHVRKSKSEAKDKPESETEKAFAGSRSGELWKLLEEKGIKRCGNQKIYSQLCVGMWAGEKPTKGVNSDIDLWTISGDTLCPIELKKDNSMVGTITEIFFYSNYMYDFFTSGNQSRSNFIPNIPTKNDKSYKEPEDSGYSLLTDPQKTYKRIAGFMLLDKASLHPFLKSLKILEVLNDNKAGGVDIRCDLIVYPDETK